MRAIFYLATFALLSASTAAFARGPGGGNGFGHAMNSGMGAPQWSGSYPPGFSSRGRRTGWHGSSVPPGWMKGHKRGWNGGNVPPGLVGR
jgi:hypothetical protein